MPNQKPKSRIGFSDEATIKVIITEHTSDTVMVRIKTIHDDCQGLFDEEEQEVNENLFCHDQDEYVILDLARINIDDLEDEVDQVIEQGGYHGLEHDDDVFYSYISFHYVYYDEDIVPRSLFDIPDQELRRVLAGAEGFVEVIWDF